MSGYFELKAAGRQFMWNLKAANHEVIVTSELYKTHEGALNGIAATKKTVSDDKHYDRRASKDGQFYFVLLAANGQSVGKSELYKTRAALENGIASVKKHAPLALFKDLSES